MKKEGRRLEVHKLRRESQGHGRSALGTSLAFRYCRAKWLHFFPQQSLVSFQQAPGPVSPQWWQF